MAAPNGPWILKQLFRRRSQRLRIVPWDSIARRLPGEIHIYGKGDDFTTEGGK